MNRFFLLFFTLPILSWGQDSLTTKPTQNVSGITIDTSRRQPSISKNYLRKDVWRLDFLGPGYLNEHRLEKQISLVSELRLVGAFRSGDRFDVNPFSFSINPELSVALRHFYNLPKRKREGKSIRYNSGSYFALKGNYVGPPLYNNSNINIQGSGASVLWGVQHTAPKHFYTNVEVGVGVAQYYKNTVSPTGNLILGYTF